MMGSDKFERPIRFTPAAGCFTGMEAVAGMAVGGSMLSALGSIGGGSAANGAANTNAMLLNQQAGLERQQGVLAGQRDKRQGKIFRGKTMAGLAASGVDPTQGSPLDVLSQEAKETEFKAENDKFAADEKAWEMQIGALVQQQQGAGALSKGIGQGIGSLLTGGAKAYGALDPFGAAAGDAAGAAATAGAGAFGSVAGMPVADALAAGIIAL